MSDYDQSDWSDRAETGTSEIMSRINFEKNNWVVDEDDEEVTDVKSVFKIEHEPTNDDDVVVIIPSDFEDQVNSDGTLPTTDLLVKTETSNHDFVMKWQVDSQLTLKCEEDGYSIKKESADIKYEVLELDKNDKGNESDATIPLIDLVEGEMDLFTPETIELGRRLAEQLTREQSMPSVDKSKVTKSQRRKKRGKRLEQNSRKENGSGDRAKVIYSGPPPNIENRSLPLILPPTPPPSTLDKQSCKPQEVSWMIQFPDVVSSALKPNNEDLKLSKAKSTDKASLEVQSGSISELLEQFEQLQGDGYSASGTNKRKTNSKKKDYEIAPGLKDHPPLKKPSSIDPPPTSDGNSKPLLPLKNKSSPIASKGKSSPITRKEDLQDVKCHKDKPSVAIKRTHSGKKLPSKSSVNEQSLPELATDNQKGAADHFPNKVFKRVKNTPVRKPVTETDPSILSTLKTGLKELQSYCCIIDELQITNSPCVKFAEEQLQSALQRNASSVLDAFETLMRSSGPNGPYKQLEEIVGLSKIEMSLILKMCKTVAWKTTTTVQPPVYSGSLDSSKPNFATGNNVKSDAVSTMKNDNFKSSTDMPLLNESTLLSEHPIMTEALQSNNSSGARITTSHQGDNNNQNTNRYLSGTGSTQFSMTNGVGVTANNLKSNCYRPWSNVQNNYSANRTLPIAKPPQLPNTQGVNVNNLKSSPNKPGTNVSVQSNQVVNRSLPGPETSQNFVANAPNGNNIRNKPRANVSDYTVPSNQINTSSLPGVGPSKLAATYLSASSWPTHVAQTTNDPSFEHMSGGAAYHVLPTHGFPMCSPHFNSMPNAPPPYSGISTSQQYIHKSHPRYGYSNAGNLQTWRNMKGRCHPQQRIRHHQPSKNLNVGVHRRNELPAQQPTSRSASSQYLANNSDDYYRDASDYYQCAAPFTNYPPFPNVHHQENIGGRIDPRRLLDEYTYIRGSGLTKTTNVAKRKINDMLEDYFNSRLNPSNVSKSSEPMRSPGTSIPSVSPHSNATFPSQILENILIKTGPPSHLRKEISQNIPAL